MFSIFISVTSCMGQYQKNEDLNYLAEHAVFFENGITVYPENGKYGFKYKNHRLSEPIYDTIYNFSRDFCVVKRDSVLSLLDMNLRNGYLQPIRSVEKHYSEEKKATILKITSKNGHSNEYTISKVNNWKLFYSTANSVAYPMRQDHYLFSHNITDSIDLADKFPEAKSNVRILMKTSMEKKSPYNEILFSAEKLKFFPKKGIPFIRNRPGLKIDDYLGKSLLEYRTGDYQTRVVIDEEKGDTVLISKFKTEGFSIDTNLYLYRYVYDEKGEVEQIQIYNEYGEHLHTFVPTTVDGHKNSAWINNGIISERIKYTRKGNIEIYHVYSAVTLEKILENVVLVSENLKRGYYMYYSLEKRTYFLINKGRLIYSFKVNKGSYAGFETIDNFEFEKEPIYINIKTIHSELIESIVISSSGKELYRSKDYRLMMRLSLDENEKVKVMELHKENNEFAIYSTEADSLYWFDAKDASGGAVTSDVLYFSTPEGTRFETLLKEPTFNFSAKSLEGIISLKNDQFWLILAENDSYTLYNNYFKELCDNCIIGQINQSNLVFSLYRDPKSTLFELINADFIPITNKRYKALLNGTKMIVALTEANEIEYLMME